MNTKITIPFCFLSNSKIQTFDVDKCQRSLFQIQELKRVSERENFAYFVIMYCEDGEVIMHPNYKGPVHIFWYTKKGQCMAGRLGRRKLLNRNEWAPVGKLNDPVFC